MNPFICGQHVCETRIHTLFSLKENEWKLVNGKWELPIGVSLYGAVRYFRDERGTWHELSFSHTPRQPVPVVDQNLIARLEQIRSHA